MDYQWIDEYLLSKLGMTKDFKVEWEWDRYLLNGKLVAAVCTNKAGENIVTVKCDPAYGEKLRGQYEHIVPGYYMNKVHWNSVSLNGTVPDEVIKKMIDQSYELIFHKLTKKMQKKIENGDV